MILKILPDARQRAHDPDTVAMQQLRRSDSRQHEQFGRTECSGTNDDRTPRVRDARDARARRAAVVTHGPAAGSFHDQTRRARIAADLEIGTRQPQVCGGRALAQTPPGGSLAAAYPLARKTVHVIDDGNARFAAGLEISVEHGRPEAVEFNAERAACSARRPLGFLEVLEAFEERQHLRGTPADATPRAPTVEVAG